MGRKRGQKKVKTEKQYSTQPVAVKHKPEKPDKKKRKQVPLKRDHPNWALTFLAGAGMVLTAYLVLTSLLGQYPLYCDEGSSCDIVQHSRWGTNLRLSMERAMAVADHLTKVSGLDASKISVAGYGEFRPAVATGDEAARSKNRRVEILLLDG